MEKIMIEFYRDKKCKRCDFIEKELKDMVLAYHANNLEVSGFKPEIVQGHRVIMGHENLLKYVDELHDTIELWRKFEGDTCYCDEDGNII